MNKNLVSVITPLYNSEQFISETIESVLAQSYQDWEMIIVDDCSKDQGVKIVKNYQNKDKRIKLIELDNNVGAAKARNKAINAAQGRFISFLDSDDIWHQDKLKKQIKFMLKNNYSFTFTSFEKINESGKTFDMIKVPKRVSYRRVLFINPIDCSTVIYDKDRLGKIYMPDIRKRQDYALWLKILKNIDYGYGLNEKLTSYRVRENSLSNNKLDLIKYHWELYRDIEKLSIIESSFYLLCDILSKILKIK